MVKTGIQDPGVNLNADPEAVKSETAVYSSELPSSTRMEGNFKRQNGMTCWSESMKKKINAFKSMKI